MSITSLGAALSHEEPHKLAHRKLSDSSSELILWGDNGCLLLKSDLLSLTGTCYAVECPTEQTEKPYAHVECPVPYMDSVLTRSSPAEDDKKTQSLGHIFWF